MGANDKIVDTGIAEDLLDLISELTPAESKVFAALFNGMNCPPLRWMDEWADAEYILPEGTSSEYGLWRTSRFPFLREILRCLSPASRCAAVSVLKASQLGFTECAKIAMGYYAAEDPKPVMYTQKTKEDVEEFSKLKLQPTIEACPSLRERFAQHRSSNGNNSLLMKTYPGGFLSLSGANTANAVSSKSIAILLLDEIDRYALNVQENGDPISLAIRRTSNFPNHKIFAFTTPAILETSRIMKLYKAGDQRVFYLPCPHCNASAPTAQEFELGDRILHGTYWPLEWKNIKWENRDPKTAAHLCTECGCLVEEHFKTWMLERGVWVAQNPKSVDQKPGDLDVEEVSFSINSLYSPLGFYSWRQAVQEFLTATEENDDTKLQAFVNTVLGECWSLAGKGVAASALEDRLEVYSKDNTFDVPAGAVILTAGADVQLDRIECEIVAWGPGEESWSIDYVVLWGDTEQDQVWQELDMVLRRMYKHESGRMMNIAASCVDSGNNSKQVYRFVKGREYRRIFAIKGDDGWGKGELRRPLKPHKEYGIWLFILFVDELKSKIYSQLRIQTPGPGYCHFPAKPEYDNNYFKMLTAESLREKTVNSQRVLYWYKPDKARNEALDCRVYAKAALKILRVDLKQLADHGVLMRNFQTQKTQSKGTRVLSRGL